MTTTTLIIPAYEPGAGLVDLVEALAGYPFRGILVVDDGSGERFRPVFDRVAAIDGVTLLHHAVNQGKGAALKHAFRYVLESGTGAQRLVTVDADGQHGVTDIVAVADRCGKEAASLVMGVRTFADDVPLRSRFGNLLTRRLLRWTKQLDLQDTQTGLRCLPLDFAEQSLVIEADRYEFEFECLLLARQKGWPIVQHPIQTIYIDENSASHFRPVVDSIRIYWVFIRYLGVSISSFALDISLFTLFHQLSGHIIGSTYTARLIAGAFNFFANKHTVFRSSDKRRYPGELFGYVALAVFIATISGSLVQWLTPISGLHASIVKIGVDSILFTISFLVQRFVIFRHKRAIPDRHQRKAHRN